MQTDWASENLQIIRTLMERGAVYRRALAPVMGTVGLTGIAASVVAAVAGVRTAGAFAGFWTAAAIICLIEALLLVRRQALKDAEPFWSSPTRRVAQALAPAFFCGLAAGIIGFATSSPDELMNHAQFEIQGVASVSIGSGYAPFVCVLVPVWMALYGCGIHAAGFFMPRGMKWLGWGFAVAGCACFLVFARWPLPAGSAVQIGNWVMGAFFGAAHAAYGAYLYSTEKRGNAA